MPQPMFFGDCTVSVGIDPGMSGGLAAIGTRRDGSLMLRLQEMPTTDKEIYDWLCSVNSIRMMAYIERVHAFPGQGVSSMFKFGMGYGGLKMALAGNNIPYQEVMPRVWQKEFSIASRGKKETPTAFKKRLIVKAQQLFPRADVRTSGVADALLIAEYCRRKFNPTR